MAEHLEQSYYLCAVVQCDFPMQMEVYRYLMQCNTYKCIAIVHDKDRYLQDYERKNGNGEVNNYKVGDLVPPHIHIIIKLPRKFSAECFTDRFANYVHFEICHDPYEYALYFQHLTFQAIKDNKVQYPKEAIFGDADMLDKYVHSVCQSSHDYITEFYSAYMRGGSPENALTILMQEGAVKTIQDVKRHAYFYRRFVCGE